MDKRIILILVLVVVIVAGVGGAFFLLNRQSTQTDMTAQEIVATPVPATTTASAQIKATLSASVSTPLLVSKEGSIDIFLDTKGAQVDGFQFIATLTGSALPTITDGDSTREGTQILTTAASGFVASTNSVTPSDNGQTIRLGMAYDQTGQFFQSSSPVKVASISVLSGSSGSIALTFDTQNSRVRLPSGEDVSAQTTAQTFFVTSDVATSTTASMSAVTALATTVTASPTPVAETSPFCLASCFSDNDCAAGYICQADRCVNPACATSQTCTCTSTQTTQTKTTASATPKASASPTSKPSSTPATASSSAVAQDIPTTGAFEYTVLLAGTALLFVASGVYLSYRQENA